MLLVSPFPFRAPTPVWSGTTLKSHCPSTGTIQSQYVENFSEFVPGVLDACFISSAAALPAGVWARASDTSVWARASQCVQGCCHALWPGLMLADLERYGMLCTCRQCTCRQCTCDATCCALGGRARERQRQVGARAWSTCARLHSTLAHANTLHHWHTPKAYTCTCQKPSTLNPKDLAARSSYLRSGRRCLGEPWDS